MEGIEQLGHIAWTYAATIVFWLIIGLPRVGPMAVLGAATAALVFALPRELIDQWPIERPWDTALDLASFTVGGALAGLTAWLTRKRKHG